MNSNIERHRKFPNTKVMALGLHDFDRTDKRLSVFLTVQSLVLALCNLVILAPQCFGSSLISNTIQTLQRTCILLFAVQCLCWVIKLKFNIGYTCKQNSSKKRVALYVQKLLRGGFLLLLAVLFFYFIAISFGAPFTVSIAETFHFSCLLTLLTAVPLCIHIGLDFSQWLAVLSGKGYPSLVEKYVINIVACTIAGAWFGAFPIPLDWDRAWQVWPITCCIGALLGNSIGNLYTAVCILVTLRHANKRQKHF